MLLLVLVLVVALIPVLARVLVRVLLHPLPRRALLETPRIASHASTEADMAVSGKARGPKGAPRASERQWPQEEAL